MQVGKSEKNSLDCLENYSKFREELETMEKEIDYLRGLVNSEETVEDEEVYGIHLYF